MINRKGNHIARSGNESLSLLYSFIQKNYIFRAFLCHAQKEL